MAYAIEGREQGGGWSRQAVGDANNATLFDSRTEAEQALPELARVLECDVSELRVVEA